MKPYRLMIAPLMAGALLAMTTVNSPAQAQNMHHKTHGAPAAPTLPGQDAFGAISEIIVILEADPATDWSKVDISALREHLVDMNQLVVATKVHAREIKGGLQMTVSGQGRSLQAIRSMLPAHAPMIDGLNGWSARTQLTDTGATLNVTAQEAAEISRIRGLGFYGLMVAGSHHQAHHLALARGEDVHAD